VPVLIDGERTVWDTLGIVIYLADRHPAVWPAEAEARTFAQCAASEMHAGFSALRNDCTMNVGVRVRPRPASAALAKDITRIREIFETGLTRFGGPWLAGADFSAADAFFAPVAFRIRTYGLDVGAGQAWVDRILAHPAMLQWEAEALAEFWREASHEEELAAAGEITADYRSG
jgi:glutathione S-transferase